MKLRVIYITILIYMILFSAILCENNVKRFKDIKNLQFFASSLINSLFEKQLETHEVLSGPLKGCIPKEWNNSAQSKSDELVSFSFLESNLPLLSKLLRKKQEIQEGGKENSLEATIERLCKDQKLTLNILTKGTVHHSYDDIRRILLQIKKAKRNNRRKKLKRLRKRIRRKKLARRRRVKKQIKLLEKSTPFLKEITEFYTSLFDKIPIVVKTKDVILDCLNKDLRENNKEISKIIQHFNTVVDTLKKKNFAKSAFLLIGPLCEPKFKESLTNLYDTIQSPGEQESKWIAVGTFIGESIRLFGAQLRLKSSSSNKNGHK